VRTLINSLKRNALKALTFVNEFYHKEFYLKRKDGFIVKGLQPEPYDYFIEQLKQIVEEILQ